MNRALSALGLARRAGKLNWGFDTAVEAMRSGGAGVGGLAGEAMQRRVRRCDSCRRPFGQNEEERAL